MPYTLFFNGKAIEIFLSYVKQWKILGTGHNVARKWEFIVPVVIQNGFTPCGFGSLEDNQ